MPFISKDWRSPGEEWVKTQEGWEKKKVLECTAQRYPALTNFNNTTDPEKNTWSASAESSPVPPHCRITVKCTREIAGFNALSEAVRRLDFVSAVSDVRRVHYTCALLGLLLEGHRLTELPAAAQRVLLSMLERLAHHVSESQQHVHMLRALVQCVCGARESERAACWGRPLGSRALWDQHRHIIDRITHITDNIHIVQPGPEVVPKLHDLPDECIREILLRLSDHRDIESCGGAWPRMSAVCSEQRTWRSLVQHHFTELQRASVAHTQHRADWNTVFHTLRKKYGLREEAQFSETLSLCRHCACLFWRSLGHPCIADQCPEYRERLREAGGPLPPHPVPPAAFLKFFSL